MIKRLTQSPFAAALGILAMISGARGVFDPDAFPTHAVLHGLDYGWAVVYFFGGLFLVLGMMLAKPRIEGAGCALFAAGSLVEAVAFVVFLGWTRTTSWVTVLTLLIFAAAALTRLGRLLRGSNQVWVIPPQ